MAKDKFIPKNPRFPQHDKMRRSVTEERYLVVCEGTKTEPNYFGWYQTELQKLKDELVRVGRRKAEDIKVEIWGGQIEIEGQGRDPKNLVQKTIEKRQKSKIDYTEVWCVFDRDSFPAKNFNDAISLARRNHIFVAYSNESFELWYLLHYDYHDSALSRVQYQKKLSTRLGKPYQKNSQTMYEDLRASGGDQQRAIQNADRLLKTYGNRTDYANHNPSTTVHLLVAALNKFLEEFKQQMDNFRGPKQ